MEIKVTRGGFRNPRYSIISRIMPITEGILILQEKEGLTISSGKICKNKTVVREIKEFRKRIFFWTGLFELSLALIDLFLIGLILYGLTVAQLGSDQTRRIFILLALCVALLFLIFVLGLGIGIYILVDDNRQIMIPVHSYLFWHSKTEPDVSELLSWLEKQLKGFGTIKG